MKSFVVQSSRKTSRSHEEVMGDILDPHTWSRWQPEITRTSGPSPLAAGDAVEGEARMLGFEVGGRSVAREIDTGVFVEDVIVGVRMRIRYEVENDDGTTVIRRHLTADLPNGLAGRVLSAFLKPRLRKMNEQVLDALAK